MAGYAPASEGESDKWSAIVNTVEENRVNYCKALSGKTLHPLPAKVGTNFGNKRQALGRYSSFAD
jgi:hypothetical protein